MVNTLAYHTGDPGSIPGRGGSSEKCESIWGDFSSPACNPPSLIPWYGGIQKGLVGTGELLVQPLGWTLCLYWVTCLRIRAFAMAVYMRRRSIIRAFDGNARLLAKITAVCIDIYIFLWGNLSRAIIYFSNSIKERFTNSTREFCNSLFADVRFGLTIRNKLVYV